MTLPMLMALIAGPLMKTAKAELKKIAKGKLNDKKVRADFVDFMGKHGEKAGKKMVNSKRLGREAGRKVGKMAFDAAKASLK